VSTGSKAQARESIMLFIDASGPENQLDMVRMVRYLPAPFVV